jgi:hypothetical protein
MRTSFMIFILLSLGVNAFASPITQQQAVTAILGEAENQGDKGILMLAWALHNRGYIRGVYGINSKRKALWSESQKKEALKAWLSAGRGEDPTKGAQYWGTDADVEIWKKESWFKNVKHTVSYKDHNFYREITK